MGKKPEQAPKVKVTLGMPAELVKQAKHYAVDHDCDLQDVVTLALAKYLKEAK